MLWNGIKFFLMVECSFSLDKNDICVELKVLVFWYVCWCCLFKKYIKLDLEKKNKKCGF